MFYYFYLCFVIDDESENVANVELKERLNCDIVVENHANQIINYESRRKILRAIKGVETRMKLEETPSVKKSPQEDSCPSTVVALKGKSLAALSLVNRVNNNEIPENQAPPSKKKSANNLTTNLSRKNDSEKIDDEDQQASDSRNFHNSNDKNEKTNGETNNKVRLYNYLIYVIVTSYFEWIRNSRPRIHYYRPQCL